MRKIKPLIIGIVVMVLAFCACTNNTLKETTQTKTEPEFYASFKPYTRWWWFSSDIDNNDVRDQLIWLRDHDFGGVEIAWIYPMGLDSTTSHPDFLSPESATFLA